MEPIRIIFTAIAVILIILILIQQKNSSLGSMMGQDAGDEMVQTRRGSDKILHTTTIALAVVFAGLGLWMMIAA